MQPVTESPCARIDASSITQSAPIVSAADSGSKNLSALMKDLNDPSLRGDYAICQRKVIPLQEINEAFITKLLQDEGFNEHQMIGFHAELERKRDPKTDVTYSFLSLPLAENNTSKSIFAKVLCKVLIQSDEKKYGIIEFERIVKVKLPTSMSPVDFRQPVLLHAIRTIHTEYRSLRERFEKMDKTRRFIHFGEAFALPDIVCEGDPIRHQRIIKICSVVDKAISKQHNEDQETLVRHKKETFSGVALAGFKSLRKVLKKKSSVKLQVVLEILRDNIGTDMKVAYENLDSHKECARLHNAIPFYKRIARLKNDAHAVKEVAKKLQGCSAPKENKKREYEQRLEHYRLTIQDNVDYIIAQVRHTQTLQKRIANGLMYYRSILSSAGKDLLGSTVFADASARLQYLEAEYKGLEGKFIHMDEMWEKIDIALIQPAQKFAAGSSSQAFRPTLPASFSLVRHHIAEIEPTTMCHTLSQNEINEMRRWQAEKTGLITVVQELSDAFGKLDLAGGEEV